MLLRSRKRAKLYPHMKIYYKELPSTLQSISLGPSTTQPSLSRLPPRPAPTFVFDLHHRTRPGVPSLLSTIRAPTTPSLLQRCCWMRASSHRTSYTTCGITCPCPTWTPRSTAFTWKYKEKRRDACSIPWTTSRRTSNMWVLFAAMDPFSPQYRQAGEPRSGNQVFAMILSRVSIRMTALR